MPPLLTIILTFLSGAALGYVACYALRRGAAPASASLTKGAQRQEPAPEERAPSEFPSPVAFCPPPASFGQLFDTLSDALLVVSPQGRILQANPKAAELFGVSIEILQGQSFGHPVSDGAPAELCIPCPGHDPILADMRNVPIPWHGDTAWLISLRNVTAQRRMESALEVSEHRYRIVADYNYDWESWTLPDGAAAYVSPSCERISGYAPFHFLQDPLFIQSIIEEEDLPAWKDFMQSSAAIAPLFEHAGQSMQLDFRIRRKDGKQVWVSQINHQIASPEGEPLGMRSSIRDITGRKRMEMELRRQALHDSLTDLPNRTLFVDRLDQARVRASRRSDYLYAICYLDLDRFSLVNDSLGHTAGDQALVAITKRIQQAVRTLDTVSRFGGDEFAILLEELVSPRSAVEIVKKIRQQISAPLFIDGSELRITASVGVVLSPMADQTADMLLRNANIALHAAKEQGRDCFKVFTAKMLDQAVLLMTMEHEMRRGVEKQEFFLAYQPFVDLRTGALTGFEALVRWRHPTRGLMPPGEFIAVAEETGAIIELGHYVLRKACRTWVEWAAKFPMVRNTLMSVNISSRQFSQMGFLDSIRNVLEETGMPPGALKLEITETAIMEDAESSSEKLNRIKDMGIALSIDDFGTGYSSMSYLQRFPLDNLKIDLSFIRLMHVSHENMEIVKAIINLAHTLGMEVVAEGVEESDQVRTLAALDCEYAQGYYFSRPLIETDMVAYLNAVDQESGVAPVAGKDGPSASPV